MQFAANRDKAIQPAVYSHPGADPPMPATSNDRRGGTKGDTGRRERLAAELRANLKRRKERERAVAAAADQSRATKQDPGDADR